MPARDSYIPLALLLVFTGCRASPDSAADRTELLRLHDLQRQAHLEKRADLLVATFADTFRNIARGEVTQPSTAESRARMQPYFDRSTFLAWDDLAPPIIRVSPDGRMAYVIVQKDVRLTGPDSSGTATEEHTVYAWLETWEKEEGKWRLTTVASTDRPGSAPRGAP